MNGREHDGDCQKARSTINKQHVTQVKTNMLDASHSKIGVTKRNVSVCTFSIIIEFVDENDLLLFRVVSPSMRCDPHFNFQFCCFPIFPHFFDFCSIFWDERNNLWIRASTYFPTRIRQIRPLVTRHTWGWNRRRWCRKQYLRNAIDSNQLFKENFQTYEI